MRACRTFLRLGIYFCLLTGLKLNSYGAETAKVARQRLRLVNPDLRMVNLRFTNGPLGLMLHGKLENGRYYPIKSFSLGALGATNCSGLLNLVQEFPLRGMFNRGYIDPNTFNLLRHSETYLTAAQVSFFNVSALLTNEEYEAKKDSLLESQVAFGPQRATLVEGKVPVTLATLYLVANRILDENGVRYTPLPWTSVPAFKTRAAELASADSEGIDFEFGRGYQVGPAYIDYAIDAALITVAHEMAIHRAPFAKSRIFVHSFKSENTLAYQKKFPTLQVVARDPGHPENVILMTPLEGIFSKERPWNMSGVIQKMIAENPDVLSVTKAWNLLMNARGSLRVDMDYINISGARSASPIVWRTSSDLYTFSLYRMMEEYGVRDETQRDRLWQIAHAESELQEPFSPVEAYADPIASDPEFAWSEVSGATVALSNFNPAESMNDPHYELRVLLGAALLSRELAHPPDPKKSMHQLRQSVFSVTTSEGAIAQRLEELRPSRQDKKFWQRDWQIATAHGQGILQFNQFTVRTFYFTFADLERLAKAHPTVFDQVREKSILRQGVYFMRGLQLRPIGF